MPDCASEQLENSDDQLIGEVESVLGAQKFASSVRDPSRSLLKLPNKVTMRVRSRVTSVPDLLLIAERGGPFRIWIDLLRENDRRHVYRQYHKDFSSHSNPDGSDATNSHIHFPTMEHPLRTHHRGDSTWACPVLDIPDTLSDSIKFLCIAWSINIEGLQEQFEWLQ